MTETLTWWIIDHWCYDTYLPLHSQPSARLVIVDFLPALWSDHTLHTSHHTRTPATIIHYIPLSFNPRGNILLTELVMYHVDFVFYIYHCTIVFCIIYLPLYHCILYYISTIVPLYFVLNIYHCTIVVLADFSDWKGFIYHESANYEHGMI